MTVADDLATLDRIVREHRGRTDGKPVLKRVEAEIARLEREKGDLQAAYLAVSAKNAAAVAEIARLRDGLLEAKWLIGAGLPHTMEWHDRADAWYTEARALLAEDGAASTCVESEDCENEWHYWRCPKHPDYDGAA